MPGLSEQEALEEAWDALGYLREWAYPGVSDGVLEACQEVARDAFALVSEVLGWDTDWPDIRKTP